MTKKKTQKNTLASWAGVKTSGAGDGNHILRFKIDVGKLRQHQASAGRNVSRIEDAPSLASNVSFTTNDTVDDATTATTSLLDSSIDQPRKVETDGHERPVTTHPFFQKARPKTAECLTTTNGTESSAAQPKQHSVEAHSFFKPRPTAKGTDPSQAASRTTKLDGSAAILPTRATMHVIPPPDGHSQSCSFKGTFIPRKRRRVEVDGSGSGEWRSDGWTNIAKSILREAESTTTATQTQDIASDGFNGPQGLAARKLTNGQHRAIQSLEGKKSVSDNDTLWSARYSPITAAEVLQEGTEAIILRDWLRSRRFDSHDRLRFPLGNKKLGSWNANNKYANIDDDFIVDEDVGQPLTSDIGAEFDVEVSTPACPAGREQLFKSNLIILTGPTGCGKSAALQAAARELSFEVFEVNPTDRRSAKDVIERVGEAAQSQMVNKQRSTDGKLSKSLILFEEVDVLYRDDKDFWNAVLALGSNSKRPIVLTCNDLSALPRQLDLPAIYLKFTAPPEELVLDYLEAITIIEAAHVNRGLLYEQLHTSSRDLRATLNAVQFLALSRSDKTADEVNLVAQEVMSRELSIPSLFRGTYQEKLANKASVQNLRAYTQYAESLSFLDVVSMQQRSVSLEEQPVYENDAEEIPARLVEKDDLVGQQVVSEPLGRYTRLHPGDLNIALTVALMLQDITTDEVKESFPIRVFPTRIRDLELEIMSADARKAGERWEAMVVACEPFGIPENWMYEYAPHSTIDRPRISGVLATEVTPFLRQMAWRDDARVAWEQAMLASYSGRTTRNTMAGEYGAGFKLPPKIPDALRQAIRETSLRWHSM